MTPAIARSILCSIDFSEQSRQALQWAEMFARRPGSSLTVLTAVDPLLARAAGMRFGLDLARTETRPALRDFVTTTWPDESARPADLKFDVRVGDAAEVILDAAARERVDLIVMGTHGLGGFRKWLLGSTTERVLRRTQTPVLVVPPAVGPASVPRPGASSLKLGPVLAATDFSETSARALRWAAEFAEEAGSFLLLVHVVEPIAVAPQWRPYVEEADQGQVADARVRLEKIAQQFVAPARREAVVAFGRPADSIASIAGEREAGVIVMGLAAGQTLGCQPGSIAYRVMCLASAPVLVVPPDLPET